MTNFRLLIFTVAGNLPPNRYVNLLVNLVKRTSAAFVTFQDIIRLVAEYYRLPVSFILVKSEYRARHELADIRAIICYLAVEFISNSHWRCKNVSQQQIAKAMNFTNRNHSNISTGHKKISDLRQVNPQLDYQIKNIERKLIKIILSQINEIS